jgi:hypothetical protein
LKRLLGGLRTGAEAGNGPHSGPYEKAEQAAYVVKCSCDPGPNGDGGQTVVDPIRLFPLRENVRWTYRVREQILPALRPANVPVKWTDVTVQHAGYTDRALRERKLQRDGKILEGIWPNGRTIRSCCSTATSALRYLEARRPSGYQAIRKWFIRGRALHCVSLPNRTRRLHACSPQ